MVRIGTDGAAEMSVGWEKGYFIELLIAAAANLGPGMVGLIVYPAGG
ncbi:MAG: hypothetical protein ABSA01_02330 [Anaerolineales bacterium]|jgi:hypothetical protein